VADGKLDFSKLDYAGFAELAKAEGLSKYERIGFPDSYRAEFETAIFEDILAKLPRLASDRNLIVMDIGPGCSDLPGMLIELCRSRGHRLELIDSPEMLGLLPDGPFIGKAPGLYPDCALSLAHLEGKADVIICYSVLHYVFVDTNLFDFVDVSIRMLAPGGRMLIGDIPNVSMRNRFFASENGRAFHKAFTKTDTEPELNLNTPTPKQIDDAVLIALVARARAAGCHAYMLPQPPILPMANRREDLLLEKP
jgi:hypothetical protein